MTRARIHTASFGYGLGLGLSCIGEYRRRRMSLEGYRLSIEKVLWVGLGLPHSRRLGIYRVSDSVLVRYTRGFGGGISGIGVWSRARVRMRRARPFTRKGGIGIWLCYLCCLPPRCWPCVSGEVARHRYGRCLKPSSVVCRLWG